MLFLETAGEGLLKGTGGDIDRGRIEVLWDGAMQPLAVWRQRPHQPAFVIGLPSAALPEKQRAAVLEWHWQDRPLVTPTENEPLRFSSERQPEEAYFWADPDTLALLLAPFWS